MLKTILVSRLPLVHRSLRSFSRNSSNTQLCRASTSLIAVHNNIEKRFLTTAPNVLSQDDRRDFMAVFPDIVRELVDHEKNTPELSNLYAKILQYNVASGKKLRGLTVVYSYRLIVKPELLTPENVRLTQILGWCVEMLQGYFIVLDDVVDQSETRRGRPCWYKVPEVGYKAVCHSLLLGCAIHTLLKKHLSGSPAYLPMIELFNTATLLTSQGQVLDCNTSNQSEVCYEKINMERYNYITTNKTAYYTFHLPVAVAMYLAGIFNPEQHRQAKSILLEIGRYYQVQDDFLDVFGDNSVIGKEGTDIEDGKCTWLSVVALQRASPRQEQIFKENFGKPGARHVNAIKELYIAMGLPALYTIYEQETYKMITTHIQQLSAGLPHDLFFGLLEKMHKRNK